MQITVTKDLFLAAQKFFKRKPYNLEKDDFDWHRAKKSVDLACLSSKLIKELKRELHDIKAELSSQAKRKPAGG